MKGISFKVSLANICFDLLVYNVNTAHGFVVMNSVIPSFNISISRRAQCHEYVTALKCRA